MEEKRFDELENETAVEAVIDTEEESGGNGLLKIAIIGVGVVGGAIGTYLYTTREKRKAKKLEKAKKLVSDNGYAIIEQEAIVEEESVSSDSEETEK